MGVERKGLGMRWGERSVWTWGGLEEGKRERGEKEVEGVCGWEGEGETDEETSFRMWLEV